MERNYTTQMDAARRGIVTPELETVARKEHMSVEELMPLVAAGKVAIPANRLHKCLDPEHRLHAPHQDQCQPGSLPGLQGLRRGDAEGALCGEYGGRGHHGPVQPWQHPALPPEAHCRVPGDDRHRPCL